MPNLNLECEWCHGTSNTIPMYIPETPVLEWMEKKLIRLDNDFTEHSLSKEEEWEILVYDEMVTSIRRGVVCTKCWKKDQKLYEKYYDPGEEDDYIRLL